MTELPKEVLEDIKRLESKEYAAQAQRGTNESIYNIIDMAMCRLLGVRTGAEYYALRAVKAEAMLAELLQASTLFLAATRESWELMNPNNHDENDCAWKRRVELEGTLAKIEEMRK